jgi:hypothetical protein
MMRTALPPLVGSIQDGNVTWQRLENLDYELLGYFLSCHLIIEHYLDEYPSSSYLPKSLASIHPSLASTTVLVALMCSASLLPRP